MHQLNSNLVTQIKAWMGHRRVNSKSLATTTKITEERLSTLLNEKSPLRLTEYCTLCEALGLQPARVLKVALAMGRESAV